MLFLSIHDNVQHLSPFLYCGLFALGMVLSARGETANDGRLPRTKRRRQKAREDRGLPPDDEIKRLARAYVERQAKHWPKLLEAGVVVASDEAIAEMVEDFKHRHRTGQCDPKAVEPITAYVIKLGGSYNRFSCDNSSPNSAVDQLVNAMDKAKDEERFIPWAYVYCDYAVTGLDAGRQGYTSYKAIVASPEHLIDTTYIDDFTRASRDELEWWRLAALSKKHGKRMVGASDGFNLSDPNWDIWITIFGLLSRLFIKGLREKVLRGMRGSRRRDGRCLGKLPLGFTRQKVRDPNGNTVLRANGRPCHEICVDPETATYRKLIFELFVEKNWSVYKITQHFNDNRIDDWNGWNESTVRGLLWSATAIGVFVFNRYRREYDREKEKWIRVENPHSEREVHYDPELAIVSQDQWRAARRKIVNARRALSSTGKLPSRNQLSATTLFSGTLVCEYCGEEIKLIRSTAKYKQMGCLNGPTGRRGCKLSTSKSMRIIEDCLLRMLRDSLLTEEAIGKLCEQANVVLQEESNKPLRNVAPLKAKATRLQRKIDKLLDQIEDEDDIDRIKVYDDRIVRRKKELVEVREEIRAAERHNASPPPLLDANIAKKYLADFSALLNSEVPVVAEAIRALTGPIKIQQEKLAGRKRGARWIATFSPDFLRLLKHFAREKDYPEYTSLEFLTAGKWIVQEATVAAIENVPAYERLKDELAEKHENGASKRSLAVKYGLSEPYVAEIIAYKSTGRLPQFVRGTRTGRLAGTMPKYILIQDDVVRLRDVENLTFPEIVEWMADEMGMNVSISTVKRSWDAAHFEELKSAADECRCVCRNQQTDDCLEGFGRTQAAVAEDRSFRASAD